MEITGLGITVHRVAAEEVEVEVEVEVEEEAATNVTITTTEKIASGKYSKRRRSNVVVIIDRIVFISLFLFYCLLFNHSFPTNPNSITNCFKLFSLLQLYNYIAPASLF